MFTIKCEINGKEIGLISVVNTGHVNKIGYHLYRIVDPKEFNHLEIYHQRKRSWEFLASSVLNTVGSEIIRVDPDSFLNPQGYKIK